MIFLKKISAGGIFQLKYMHFYVSLDSPLIYLFKYTYNFLALINHFESIVTLIIL